MYANAVVLYLYAGFVRVSSGNRLLREPLAGGIRGTRVAWSMNMDRLLIDFIIQNSKSWIQVCTRLLQIVWLKLLTALPRVRAALIEPFLRELHCSLMCAL